MRVLLTGLGIGCAVVAAVGQGASLPEAHAYSGRLARVEVDGCAEEIFKRFEPVVRWHTSQYPEMELEDVYKLLHQSVAGPAHAIENPEMARQWLDREWEGLGSPLEEEEMLEPLSSDGRLVRVNLRSWRAAGREPEPVLNAFVQTAGTLPPDTARIRTELDAISACADRIAAGLGFSASSIHAFFSDRARDGYPAIHHSESYERAYRPAYRVVIRSYLD